MADGDGGRTEHCNAEPTVRRDQLAVSAVLQGDRPPVSARRGRELQRGEPRVQRVVSHQRVVRCRTATTRPRSITTMRSAWRTVASRCAMISVVRRVIRRSSASCTMRSLSASSALVASSSSRIGRSASTARAIASRCRWPPDSRTPRSPSEARVAVGQPLDELGRRRPRRRRREPRRRSRRDGRSARSRARWPRRSPDPAARPRSACARATGSASRRLTPSMRTLPAAGRRSAAAAGTPSSCRRPTARPAQRARRRARRA